MSVEQPRVLEVECLESFELNWSEDGAFKTIAEGLGPTFEVALESIFDPILKKYKEECPQIEVLVKMYKECMETFYQSLFSGALFLPNNIVKDLDVVEKIIKYVYKGRFFVNASVTVVGKVLPQDKLYFLDGIAPKTKLGILKPISSYLGFSKFQMKEGNYFFAETNNEKGIPIKDWKSPKIIQSRLVKLLSKISTAHGISFVRKRSNGQRKQDFNRDLARIAFSYAIIERNSETINSLPEQ